MVARTSRRTRSLALAGARGHLHWQAHMVTHTDRRTWSLALAGAYSHSHKNIPDLTFLMFFWLIDGSMLEVCKDMFYIPYQF